MEQWVRIWTFWRGTEQAVCNFEWLKTLWGNGSSTRPRYLPTRSSFVETTVYIRTFHCSADVHEKFKNHSLKNDMKFCRWQYDEWHLHSSYDRLIGFLACSIHSASLWTVSDITFSSLQERSAFVLMSTCMLRHEWPHCRSIDYMHTEWCGDKRHKERKLGGKSWLLTVFATETFIFRRPTSNLFNDTDDSINFNNTYDFFGSMCEAFTEQRCDGTALCDAYPKFLGL